MSFNMNSQQITPTFATTKRAVSYDLVDWAGPVASNGDSLFRSSTGNKEVILQNTTGTVYNYWNDRLNNQEAGLPFLAALDSFSLYPSHSSGFYDRVRIRPSTLTSSFEPSHVLLGVLLPHEDLAQVPHMWDISAHLFMKRVQTALPLAADNPITPPLAYFCYTSSVTDSNISEIRSHNLDTNYANSPRPFRASSYTSFPDGVHTDCQSQFLFDDNSVPTTTGKWFFGVQIYNTYPADLIYDIWLDFNIRRHDQIIPTFDPLK